MKIVNAFVSSHRLSQVVEAIHRVDGGLTGVTVLHAHGHGSTRAPAEGERAEELGFLTAYEKIEILCSDRLAGEIVTAIEMTAHTGLRGDGKIYVCAVEEAVRIATGERGEDAV